MNAPRLVFKDVLSHEIHQALAPLGVSPRIARRLQAAVLRGAASSIPDEMPEVSPRLLDRVRDVAEVPRLECVRRDVDPQDGFVKYGFRGVDERVFETVWIPLRGGTGTPKAIVCVSSQVGCALGCAFCATARMGFVRNLETWEIVDQVVRASAESDLPVRGVVFMGMGEPLLNYERVLRAAEILREPCGMAIAAKAITISTVGVVPRIRSFARARLPYRLVASLTSAIPERRRELLPIEDDFPIDELFDALAELHAATGRRITLAWTLISGRNTDEAEAIALAERTRSFPVKVDLIDVNDATGRFLPPDDAERDAFRDALTRHVGCPVDRRYSGGKSIRAACGMLATEVGAR